MDKARGRETSAATFTTRRCGGCCYLGLHAAAPKGGCEGRLLCLAMLRPSLKGLRVRRVSLGQADGGGSETVWRLRLRTGNWELGTGDWGLGAGRLPGDPGPGSG